MSMNYLIFYLQFHKKVTEVALYGVCFAVSGISLRFKIRREYKKEDEGRVFIRETQKKANPSDNADACPRD